MDSEVHMTLKMKSTTKSITEASKIKRNFLISGQIKSTGTKSMIKLLTKVTNICIDGFHRVKSTFAIMLLTGML
jgi:hypothetical protein